MSCIRVSNFIRDLIEWGIPCDVSGTCKGAAVAASLRGLRRLVVGRRPVSERSVRHY